MSPRLYQSSRRAETAELTRARLLKAASAMLASPDGISLDAVAKRAGVTRLTVYNQFGSRRALLEAVFNDLHQLSISAPNANARIRPTTEYLKSA